MTSRHDLQGLLEGVDIAAVMGLANLRGPATGERHGPCPKCGGRDRFRVRWYGGRSRWACRQCEPKGGDLIAFLQWREGLGVREAIQEAERLIGRPGSVTRAPAAVAYVATGSEAELPPGEDWQARIASVIEVCEAGLWADTSHAAAARRYLAERGLRDETIRAYRVGYQATGPGREISGHYVAQGFTLPSMAAGSVWQLRIRRPPGALKANPELSKYTGVKGNKTGLFNADSLRGARVAILTGGEFDAMIVAQALADIGRADVGAVTFGSESKSPSLRWRMALARVDRVIVAYDADGPGEAGAAKWIEAMGDRAERVRVPDGKDVSEYWQRGGDVGAWLRAILAGEAMPEAIPPATTGAPVIEAADVPGLADEAELVIAWLESAGYVVTFSPEGHIVANGRPTVGVGV